MSGKAPHVVWGLCRIQTLIGCHRCTRVATCVICDTEFDLPAKSTRKTCTKVCQAQLARQTKADLQRAFGDRPKTKPASKWVNPHARGVKGAREDLGDIYMRSRWEANAARFLDILIMTGDISFWEYEPEVFHFPVKRGITKYTPDFKVTRTDGSHYWLEVKGWMDKPSKIKIKRFGIHYPKETLVILDDKQYRAMEREFKDIIPNWEIKQ